MAQIISGVTTNSVYRILANVNIHDKKFICILDDFEHAALKYKGFFGKLLDAIFGKDRNKEDDQNKINFSANLFTQIKKMKPDGDSVTLNLTSDGSAPTWANNITVAQFTLKSEHGNIYLYDYFHPNTPHLILENVTLSEIRHHLP